MTIDGLDDSFSSFDYDLLEFQFFNFTESKNLTVDITLTDLEGLSQVTQVKFIFEIQKVIEPEDLK